VLEFPPRRAADKLKFEPNKESDFATWDRFCGVGGIVVAHHSDPYNPTAAMTDQELFELVVETQNLGDSRANCR
jgi:hypothetical protein